VNHSGRCIPAPKRNDQTHSAADCPLKAQALVSFKKYMPPPLPLLQGKHLPFSPLIRRKATLVDTGLEDISELNDTFLSLKLSSEGVLGKDFEEKLKSRSETNKLLYQNV
jgi:hypothetical protein